MKLDMMQVEKKLEKLDVSSEKIAIKAVRAAALKLLEDSKQKIPRAPFKEGHLYAQHEVDSPQFKINNISMRVGASTPYAARLHEALSAKNWTLPGSGPKYILNKIMNFSGDYFRIMYTTLQEGLKAL